MCSSDLRLRSAGAEARSQRRDIVAAGGRPASGGESGAQAAGASVSGRQLHILLAEDNPYNQAIMAAQAGANFVSLFWGRIRDIGYDAGSVVAQTREALDRRGSDSEIIVGSIRHLVDVNEAIQAGAHIITVPPKFFPQMCAHPKTDEAVQQFVTEFQKSHESGFQEGLPSHKEDPKSSDELFQTPQGVFPLFDG